MVSDNSTNICDLDCPRKSLSCSKTDCSPYSLHDDIHNVIDTMGPPTPMFPLDIGCESADDTTISSVRSGGTITNTSNSSFVEVLIKNHHKSKTPKTNEKFSKRNKSPVFNNAAVQTSTVKTAKEVQFQDCRSSTSSSSFQQKGVDKMEPKRYPSGIITNVLPPCPHAPSSYYQMENKSFSNGLENIRSKHNSSYTIFPNNKSAINEDNYKSEKQNTEDQFVNRSINKQDMVYKDDSDDNPQCAPTFTSSCNYKGSVKEKIELYYFDHGNAAYYNTTDSPPAILADFIAEKTENAATRFWAQIFGIANVAVSLVTSFILQLIRFILFSIVRPLTVGLIQLFSDYFLKPLLSSVFNGLIQPPFIFIYNILTSIRDIFEPIAHALGFFLKEISVIFRACRLVEIRKSESNRMV